MFSRKEEIRKKQIREDILTRYLREEVEKAKAKPKSISPKERTEIFKEKYKDIELRPCPICNSKALLIISLREYTQSEGFAGGYDITSKIDCTNCTCGLAPKLIYTNIRFSDEKDNDEKVDEIVSTYLKEWNTRYDDHEKFRSACRHISLGEPEFVVFEHEQSEKEEI